MSKSLKRLFKGAFFLNQILQKLTKAMILVTKFYLERLTYNFKRGDIKNVAQKNRIKSWYNRK